VIRVAAVSAATLFTTATLIAGAGSLAVPAPRAVPASPFRPPTAAHYAEGAPPGFSGGFREQSCHACHFHAEVNSGSGRVTIADVPERFVAGERYAITITLARPGMTLGGFQLTARFTDGGAQAGTLAPAAGEEARIGVEVHDGVQYAGQRRLGAALVAPDTARWALVWTAPEAGAPVAFHVAATAANADESVDGDHVHTAVVESGPFPPRSLPAGRPAR
jgi:hypothetical protein